MAAKQASTKRTSLMLGIDSDDTQLALKTSHRRRDEQRLESKVELTKLLNENAGRQKWCTQDGWRFENKVGLGHNNWSHENTTKDHMFPR